LQNKRTQSKATHANQYLFLDDNKAYSISRPLKEEFAQLKDRSVHGEDRSAS